MKASDSYRDRAAQNRRRVKRIVSPNTDKMYGLAVPDPIIAGKYLSRYYRTKKIRDKKIKDYPGAKKIEPKK